MPATQNNSDTPAIELQVVRRVGDGTPGPGRPLRLNARRLLKIIHLVERGESTVTACHQMKVSYSGFRGHVTRNEKYKARLKRAEEVRFNLRHEEALASVMAAGERSWMAHAWWLERNLPERYALKRVDRDDSSTEPPLIGDRIPAERLAEYSRIMAEVAAEDAALKTAKVTELPNAS